MKLSSLIEDLTSILDRYGDLKVYSLGDTYEEVQDVYATTIGTVAIQHELKK